MSNFLSRLDDEEKELADKVEKLDDFIENNQAFQGLSLLQKTLLTVQLGSMKMYLFTLRERITDLNKYL